MITRSISKFIKYLILTSVFLWGIGLTAWLYLETTHEVEELFDAEMAQMARVLQSLLRAKTDPKFEELAYQLSLDAFECLNNDESTRLGHKYEKKLAFQVWSAQGQPVIGNSKESLHLSFEPVRGYATELGKIYHWRTFTLHDEQLGLWIKTAQRSDVRDELAWEIVQGALLPLLTCFPLVMIVISQVIRQGFIPLQKISQQLQQTKPEDLCALDVGQAPLEVSPLIHAINSLMQRVKAAFIREREFTADAAHELRTPLTAIRLHTQNLQQQLLPSPTEREQRSLSGVIAGVSRMTHVVDQLLSLSQISACSPTSDEPVALKPLIESMVRQIEPLVKEKRITLELYLLAEPVLFIKKALLITLIQNLLDNALNYSPTDGQIHVNLSKHELFYELSILDNGPGIPEAERSKVLERFYRSRQSSAPGSGLGLAIVQNIVNQVGAKLSLNSGINQVGLGVRVQFPIV